MGATKGAGNVTVSFKGSAIEGYMNQADLNVVVSELEATDFDSLAEESDPGLSKTTFSIGGDWHDDLDDILAGDAATAAKRTTIIVLTDADGGTVTYTWTLDSYITNYQISASATGKIVWTATLNLSGKYDSRTP